MNSMVNCERSITPGLLWYSYNEYGQVREGHLRLVDTGFRPWITLAATQGIVAPGGSGPVAFTVDTTGLPLGTYDATLAITNTDPDLPQFQVEVLLTVTNDPTPVRRIAVGAPGAVMWMIDPPDGNSAIAAGRTTFDQLDPATAYRLVPLPESLVADN
jgi:hypothetical protein